MPTGKQNNEPNTEIETQPVAVGAKISKCSNKLVYISIMFCIQACILSNQYNKIVTYLSF